MKQVSVCMATRNGERFLPAQLATILPQLGPADELVVSDDSSTDGTLEILASVRDPRLRILPGNTFFSPVYNLENALRAARGEILVPADQDDLWYPGRLELIRGHLGARTGRVWAIMTDGDLLDAAGNPTGSTLFRRYRASRGLVRNLVWNCYTGCAMAFTRPLLELALPFPAGIPMHDVWLGLLAELNGSVDLLPARTIGHRRHGQNASHWRFQPWRQVRERLRLALQLHRRQALVRGTAPGSGAG